MGSDARLPFRYRYQAPEMNGVRNVDQSLTRAVGTMLQESSKHAGNHTDG